MKRDNYWTGRRTVTVLAVVGALGVGTFGVLPLVAPLALVPGKAPHEALTMLAHYLAIRNLVLAGVIGAALRANDTRVLRWVLITNGIIQSADIAIGIETGNPAQAAGPALFAALFFGAAALCARQGRRAA